MFLLDPGVTYLNHGAFGACPEPVMQVFQGWQRELERQPVDLLTRRADALLRESSERLAAYVGAEDLVLVPNATYGMNMVARSLPLRAGDRVLITDHEYGAVERLWELVCERAGATLVRCPLPVPLSSDDEVLEAFERELDGARVVSLSHVTSPTGLVLPVAELCRRAREAGAVSVIDGAHGPGQLDLALTELGCDFYVGNCHKWLYGPKVAGFLYTRPGVELRVDPLVVSWGWDEPDLAARTQWQGTQDLSAYLSIPAAIDFVVEHDDARARCVEDAAYLHARLLELPGVSAIGDASMLRQMVSVAVPPGTEVPADIEVPISQWRDRTLLRASVAMYNDRADLDRLIDALTYATAR